MTGEAPLKIEFKGVCKSFGPNQAVDQASFAVKQGSIHGIVGENGAGKSTAMKLLCGIYRPDRGVIHLNGKPVEFRSAVDAVQHGIGMVHQHFMLAEPFSGLENLILFRPGVGKKSWFAKFLRLLSPLNLKQLREEYCGIATDFSLEVDLDSAISDLSVGQQQRLELLKVLSQGADIIIFDEPTAVLTPQEVELFFKGLAILKGEGKTILLITHKLNEIAAITDHVTILRHGKTVGSVATQTVTKEEIAALMVGNKAIPQPIDNPVPKKGVPVLKVSGLSGQLGTSRLECIDLELGPGEILGVAGVEGNGQDALIQALLNPEKMSKLRGGIEILGQQVKSLSGQKIRDLGVVSLPEDRIRFGVIPEFTLYESLLIGQYRRAEYQHLGFYSFSKIKATCQQLLDRFDVRPARVELRLDSLSGGNQQKFVVGRELLMDPKLIIAAHPTRGVDILAKAQIYNELVLQAQRGTGLLVISSDIEELFQLCHRIVVIFKGSLVREFSVAGYDLRALGAAMGGIK
jgi:simple sugar transport system ATP-binding protein